MINRVLLLASALGIMTSINGCGTGGRKPQEFFSLQDPGTPSANVRIDSTYNWTVQRLEVDCAHLGQPHTWKETYLADFRPGARLTPWQPKLPPPEYYDATLPAGLSTFEAKYVQGNKSCNLDFDALLMPSHNYKLNLGIEDKGFLHADQCKAALVDIETGTPPLTFLNKPMKRVGEAACNRRALVPLLRPTP
jgi:hypothetical protein